VYWNGTSRPGFPREKGESELHYQIRNWYFFTWMSGDHILEQHCHNLDVANWVLKGEMPVKATGQGGRQVRRAKENGTIFDHHTVEFEYENGMRILSQCCQIGGKCQRDVSEHFHGTKAAATSATAANSSSTASRPAANARATRRTRISSNTTRSLRTSAPAKCASTPNTPRIPR
jgi:predicted dehydrogenase